MWVNTKDAASYLGVPLRTFEMYARQIRRRQLGRRFVYETTDLDEWLRSR